MKRKYYFSGTKKLSYIDFGGRGKYIIMLHGHFGCASMFSNIANILKQSYRVIALDQQGHGFSDWSNSYSRQQYIDDLASLYAELRVNEAIIIGHSLGAVNGYQFAARYPSKVKSLIIEDIGVIIDNDASFILEWPKYLSTVRQCYRFLNKHGIGNYMYFMESLEQIDCGWRFKFDADGLVRSQIALNGDWTKDWQKIKCNILLMRGSESDVLSRDHANDLIKNTPNMTYREFEGCGHTIRDKNFEGYKNTILEFLK